ncbi:MAG: hypothetical protein HY329_14745 [Chloroflexi bacterium]|nr:hypothetical protein [Chloroflexota bacterium]
MALEPYLPGEVNDLDDDERELIAEWRRRRALTTRRPRLVELYEPERRPRSWTGLLGSLAIGSLLLLILLAAGIVLALFLSFANMSTGAVNGIEARISAAAAQTGRAVGAMVQAIGDAMDPTHPPRQPLVLDSELDELVKVGIGDRLGNSKEYRFTVKEIRKRSGAGAPETAQYAVVHREYVTPKERKLLGVTYSTDKGEQDFYLDRGEAFRIGRDLFKVNWVSMDRQQLALVKFRHADQYSGPLEFQSE